MRDSLKYIFLSGFIFLTMFSVTARNRSIERFAEVVDSLHNHIVFPHNIAPGIVLTNIGVDKKEKMLVINYMLNPELVESVVNNASSENGIAQLLRGYDEIFSTSMIDASAGYSIVITSPSADGINMTETVTVPASAIPAVYTKLKNGDYSSLKPYLEMLQSTFSNMRFPLRIVNGVYLTNAFIKGKEAHWVYQIDGSIDKSGFTDAVIQNNRMNLINNLRANMNPDYLMEIEEEGISLHYSYRDEKDNTLFEFIFTAYDLRCP